MIKIKVQKLQEMDFADLGAYYKMLDPKGFHMGSLYPDKIVFPTGSPMPVAFSTYIVHPADKMLVPGTEYHEYTPECILPLDGDIICYAAPASKTPIPEIVQAFLVPHGTMVYLRAGVWHQGSFAAGDEDVHTLVTLPQRTYKADTYHVEYPVGEWVEIVRD